MEKAEHKMERIVLDKALVDKMEEDMLIRRHIERYALVRQYLFGNVLDAACGVGYGTYLLAKNPDVTSIRGVDCDNESIAFANSNFKSDKIFFENNKIEDVIGEYDILVSLETIEHLEEPIVLAELAERCNIKEIIVSYPTKKTTHYNKYHHWDLDTADLKYIFSKYECINEIINGDSMIMHFIKRNRNGYPVKRYLVSKT
jgi:2-polyprenyl-3-methyl-5-hydroxy-6-metoxy-1,4-benzoquinol methylase